MGNIAAQAVGALSGLLLARWLSVPDYAIYIVLITLIGAMSILTKGGVNLAFTSILGRNWPDVERVRLAKNAASLVRGKLSIVLLPILLSAGILLFVRSGATPPTLILLTAVLTICWWADMRSKVVDQILLFAGKAFRLQVLETALAILRLAALLTVYKVAGLGIASAAILTALFAVARVRPVEKWTEALLTYKSTRTSNEAVVEIETAVKRQLPVEIFFILQSQLVLFVLTSDSQDSAVAGYGALSRISQLFAPVSAFVAAACVPAFSKTLKLETSLLLKFTGLSAIPGLTLLGLTIVWPGSLLWLIGPSYSNLHTDLVVAVAVTAFTSTVGVTWTLLANRGMLRWTWLQIPIGVAWSIAAILFLPVHTISGAFMLQGGFAVGLLAAAAAEVAFGIPPAGTHANTRK